jgi:hypothetical protein
MHFSSYLIIPLLLMAVVSGAGCTSDNGRPLPVAVPAVSSDLSPLLINSTEVPPDFTQTEKTAKKPADMGTLAKDLGWQGGFLVKYASPGQGTRSPTEIIQSIAIYPDKNIPAISAIVNMQDRSDSNLTYADLAVYNLGNNSRAFSGKEGGSVLLKSNEPSNAGNGNTNITIVEIIFSKGTTFEVMRMTGPESNTETLKGLAYKAYVKIP